MWDWFPLVSQIKSLVQVLSGDSEGARDTQIGFIEKCPIVSQVTSAIQAIRGDCQAARDTQIKFVGFISNVLDTIPGIGYIKGIVHYVFGNRTRGDHSMKASSRTVGMIAGATVGFYLKGLFGASVGGIFGSLLLDFIITGILTDFIL